MTTLTIVLLASITFITRYFFIHPKLPITLNQRMQKFLSYSAPSVLTAIWVPIILTKQHQLVMSLSSPYLWGALVAMLVAWRTKSIYFTALGGGSVFVIISIFMESQ